MGVLETAADSSGWILVGACRATICAGVPTDSLDVGGPKFGRRRLKPNPVKESSSSCEETDRLLMDVAGILFASLTGVDIASSA